ncbi:NADP-dependent oxidoreductase [Streptomyces sp. NPDC021098]|uniref:NADP-dependent oxidoreductase n=1 Tax=unclassified Streptomyces TaxID=2593676 RepID=UPI0037972B03
MFALQYSELGPPEVLTVGEAEEPHAGPGEVRIAVRATGLTPADWKLRAGAIPAEVEVRLDWPHIPGLDAAGVVDEIGEGVSDVAVGDAVFGVVDFEKLGGAAAEFAVLAAWAAKPDALSWEEAGGAAGNVETATRALDLLGVGEGTTLLVEGAAGGVGTVTVQLAAARGATVIGTAREANHAFLTGLGATPTTYGPGLPERVAALAPQGVDAVLDAAGSGSLPDLVAIAGDARRVVSVADMAAHQHGVHLTWARSGDTPGYDGLAVAARLAAEGRFRVPLHGVFPLKDAAKAHELSATGHVRGKVVLTVP